jgi:hypothetical protein
MAANFELAPPPKTVGGLLSVPIDIDTVSAVFTFDGATQTATADATMTYKVGPTAGNPFFDLRQTITQAWLDGAVIPVAQLAHRDFGTPPFTNLRVIQSAQAAGSNHTLRVQYGLALPDCQMGGSYLPKLEWAAGPRLLFAFGMSDLNKARYAEAWLPANLIFDQFRLDLEVRIINAAIAHSAISNGTVTAAGVNHWNIAFPARFTALSHMLEVRATDTLAQHTDSVNLPVSGNTVTVESSKPTASAVDLVTQTNNIKSFLTANENNYGAYVHGNRFVALFSGGGMEYEGGTTTSSGALLHETYHSWFARGIKPSSQADGWWDEGFTTFHDDGANDTEPFDYTQSPILLCSRDPWQRATPGNAYGDGSRFWRGIAAMIGVANLNALMRDFYNAHRGNPVSTAMIEEFLVRRNGNPEIVDAFHRFVYGLQNSSPAPQLWMKDNPADPGNDQWSGTFWDSPDLWVRNADDGGTTHQAPETGQDNWFHARVRNKSGAGNARHFVVTFHARGFLGTQFVFPGDFLPSTAAKAEFDLAPGATRIVKARWPRALVPRAGTHTCMLASILARGDQPVAGRHVWEHNNLAQKNLETVDLRPETFILVPIVVRNWMPRFDPRFELEVWRPKNAAGLSVSLVHQSREFLLAAKKKVKPFLEELADQAAAEALEQLDCGAEIHAHVAEAGPLTSDAPDRLLRRFPRSFEAALADTERAKLPVKIAPMSQAVVGLKIAASAKFKAKKPVKLHFVQRSVKTKEIVGGVAVLCRAV